jgi:hypothetical protein
MRAKKTTIMVVWRHAGSSPHTSSEWRCILLANITEQARGPQTTIVPSTGCVFGMHMTSSVYHWRVTSRGLGLVSGRQILHASSKLLPTNVRC